MTPDGEAADNRNPDQVRADIDRARQQVASSVVALKSELAMTTDWRAWVRKNPVACLAGVFVLGFVLGHRR